MRAEHAPRGATALQTIGACFARRGNSKTPKVKRPASCARPSLVCSAQSPRAAALRRIVCAKLDILVLQDLRASWLEGAMDLSQAAGLQIGVHHGVIPWMLQMDLLHSTVSALKHSLISLGDSRNFPSTFSISFDSFSMRRIAMPHLTHLVARSLRVADSHILFFNPIISAPSLCRATEHLLSLSTRCHTSSEC